MSDPVTESSPLPPPPSPSARIELRAALLMLLMLALLGASVLYVLYARGAFERTQKLVLVSDDSEGVSVGMDITFSGFPIGRVSRIELAEDGNARIVVEIPEKDARWLRKSSVFTMERGIVGGTRIRAYTGMMNDEPLPPGAERKVLRGDATAEIPRLVSATRDLVANLQALTASDAALSQSLANMQSVSEKLKGPQGALGVLFGNEADARKLVATLERTNALLVKADAQVFGDRGVMNETRATVVQLNGLLTEARNSLKKVDAVLVEAQGIATNTREATTDLGVLRAEVEGSLRKVEHLVNEINRKWPFARETEIKLP